MTSHHSPSVLRFLEEEERIPIGWAQSEEGVSKYFVIFLPLLSVVLILAKFLHDRPVLSAVLPEIGMTVIVGIIAGSIIHLIVPNFHAPVQEEEEGVDGAYYTQENEEVASGLLSFSSTFFFSALLPPIIFNSGYHINRGEIDVMYVRVSLI